MWDEYAIVDDNKFDRLICNRIITKLDEGAEVHEFESAQEIMDYLTASSAKDRSLIIFLDINMPEMNGYEFIDLLLSNKLLKGRLSKLSIVIMTSSTRASDRQKAMDYKCVKGFLQKPMKVKEVEDVLRSKVNH